MGKMLLAKRFGSIAYIEVQSDLTSNRQIGQKIVSYFLSEVTWENYQAVKKSW